MHVMITGCDSGLGLALARIFSADGHIVHAGQVWDSAELRALASERPGLVLPVTIDLRSADSVHTAVRDVAARTPAIDLLINNAGISSPQAHKPLAELDLEDGEPQAIMNINAFGTMRVTQAFLPLLMAGTRRMIIIISSEAGSVGLSQRVSHYSYCMSKAALNMFTKILRNDLRRQGFTIFAVQPGWMRTGMGGPNGELDPAEPASGIHQLALRTWTADEPFYVDWRGQPLTY